MLFRSFRQCLQEGFERPILSTPEMADSSKDLMLHLVEPDQVPKMSWLFAEWIKSSR